MSRKEYQIRFNRDKYHLQQDMMDWCNENIGCNTAKAILTGEGRVWNMESVFGNTYFKFYDEKHYNWFVLRWS